MENKIKNPAEEEALNFLNNRDYMNATRLFYQLFQKEPVGNDRHLTHACVAVWMGIQNCCHTAGSIYICAMTGCNDSRYASELFITSLFRLRHISSAFSAPLTEKICDTVEKVRDILKHLVNEKESTYAMAWYANVLRGMNSFNDCKNFIDQSLEQEKLPEGVVKQLRNCRENIKYHGKDCIEFSHHVKKAFPDLPAINAVDVQDLNDLITKIWKAVRGMQEEETELPKTSLLSGKVMQDREVTAERKKEPLISYNPEDSGLKPEYINFILKSLSGSAFCTTSISDLKVISSRLSEAFLKSGISPSGVSELITNSLIAICPVCHDYISGGALLMMDVFSLAGETIFSGNTGGMERLMAGKCKSYSCFSASYDLYWCPDLDEVLISDIKNRHGLHITKSVQEKRDPIWSPEKKM